MSEIVKIPLTQGRFALVDEKNLEKVSKYNWSLSKNGNKYYARRRKPGKRNKSINIYMHHDIIGKKYGLVVDHINNNTLDNTEKNLRFVTKSINALNSNKSKCYYYDKNKKKFVARISLYKKNIFTSYFKEEKDAIKFIKKNKKKIIENEINKLETIK